MSIRFAHKRDDIDRGWCAFSFSFRLIGRTPPIINLPVSSERERNGERARAKTERRFHGRMELILDTVSSSVIKRGGTNQLDEGVFRPPQIIRISYASECSLAFNARVKRVAKQRCGDAYNRGKREFHGNPMAWIRGSR